MGKRTLGQATSALRYAAEVDWDNIAINRGHLLSPGEMSATLAFLDPYLGGMPVRLAASESALRPYVPELAWRGWGITCVEAGPDVADRWLVGDGLHLAGQGVTDLVVVSGDWRFAELASVARLHVIARRGCLSTRLELAATTVTYLPTAAVAAKAVA